MGIYVLSQDSWITMKKRSYKNRLSIYTKENNSVLIYIVRKKRDFPFDMKIAIFVRENDFGLRGSLARKNQEKIDVNPIFHAFLLLTCAIPFELQLTNFNSIELDWAEHEQIWPLFSATINFNFWLELWLGNWRSIGKMTFVWENVAASSLLLA